MADGIEIERKFLVERLPDGLDAQPSGEIEQGYLAITDDVEVRLRRYGEETFLTVKSSGDGSRIEEEIEIEARRFAALWPLTDGRRLEKRRYAIPYGDGLTIELDVYHGRLSGLLTAEVEFDTPRRRVGVRPAGLVRPRAHRRSALQEQAAGDPGPPLLSAAAFG